MRGDATILAGFAAAAATLELPVPHPDTEVRRHRILTEVRAIPPGQVTSYGAVARRAGFPRCARLVARLLATSDEAALPWHRVLRSDGRIAFARGSAGFEEQCARLRAEGVQVHAGRVRIQADAARWLDEVLWGR